MKKIIINADDFGYSSGVNQGIIKAFREGVLSSTTLMANMPGCDEAIKLAKDYPGLGVGAHLVLTCGAPMTQGTTLKGEDGKFHLLQEYHQKRNEINDEEIFKEWCTQIDYLLNQGVPLTHLDSHHHVHTFEGNESIVKRISEKYKLTFRNAFGLEERVDLNYQKDIRGFADLMNYSAIRNMDTPYLKAQNQCLEEIQRVLERVTEDITELMVHPAFVDEALYFGSSFNVQRIREVELLTAPQVKSLIEAKNLEIVHYGNL